MPNKTICGIDFEIIDAKEAITLADSFVTNKIGTGNGEAKLYVGQNNDDTKDFWDDFVPSLKDCFLIKEDLLSFLKDAKCEFLHPSQPYRNPKMLPAKFDDLFNAVSALPNGLLEFNVFKSNINPPRIYINSSDHYYRLIREMGLPNISYLSILKLKRLSDNKVFYYFKQFIEYNSESLFVHESIEKELEDGVRNDKDLSKTFKETIIKARVGQGLFRTKLLKEYSCCPITLVNDERLLIASHIKPWAAEGITNEERVDPKNGILLSPTYDKLFDRGFISFTDKKEMMVSPWLSTANQKRLDIANGKKIPGLKLGAKRKAYLAYHRENVFKK